MFNNRKQEEGESIDTYVNVLRNLAKNCDFKVLNDELIRDRIVCGIRDAAVRKSLLQMPNLTLQKCIDTVRAAEITSQQLKKMNSEAESTVHAVSSAKHKKVKTKKKIISCKYCGKQHEWNKEICPAYGTKCAKCKQYNHFAIKCPQSKKDHKKYSQHRRSKIHYVDGEEEYNTSDTTDEDILHVTTEEVNSVNNLQNKIYATMCIQDKPVRFQVDSGATCNLLPHRYLPKDVTLEDTDQRLTMYNKSEMKPRGKCILKLRNPKTKKKHKVLFYVVDTNTPILGSRAAQGMNLIKVQHENILNVSLENPITMSTILREHSEVFTGEGCFGGELHLEVDKTITPVKTPLRRIPVALKKPLKQELSRLQELGIITKVETPTDWISSLVVVKKPSGKMRICIDPKPLNRALKRSHYPLKVIEELLPELQKAKVFTTCDVKNGFWHVKLDTDSSYLTTFETPFGRFRWLRMPFGISPASEYFQHALEQAIEGLAGTYAVADDILVIGEGETYEEAEKNHDERLTELLNRCQKKGIKLNEAKFKLKQKELPFIGHVLTDKGLKADPTKVQAILEMEKPEDVKGVRRTLGLVNYMSKFLNKLADISEPLSQLTHKDNEFLWTKECESAFQRIKEAITKTPVLKFFNTEETTVLQCDASSIGLGAALLQQGRPVIYASRKLTSTERNYAQIEKELLAIVFGMERFHQFTCGRKIIINSDHKPLEVICKKSLASAPKCLQSMLLRLQRYDFEAEYKQGEHMYIADTLSRSPIEESTRRSEAEIGVESINMVDYLPITKDRISKIKLATENDPDLHQLKETILTGWPNEKSEVPEKIRIYYNHRDELAVQDGIIFRSSRCVVPKSLRKSMLEKIHSSHMGMESSLRRARECIYWPSMNSEIKDYISQCETCQTFNTSQRKETLMPHDVATRPWQRVGSDLFSLKGQDFLITVDYYSHYFEIDRLETTSSKAVIRKTKAHFARHGIPDIFISDNGPQFTSSEFREFTNSWGIEHYTSSPGHSKSNGMAESAVKVAKQLIRKAQHSHSDVYLAILDYRNTPAQNTNTSPAQKLLGRRTKTLLPTAKSLLQPSAHKTEETVEKLSRSQAKQAHYYNKNARDLDDLKQGETVRIKPFQLNQKEWTKGVISQRLDQRSYEVETPTGTYRRNRVYLRRSNEKSDTKQNHNYEENQDDKPSHENIQNQDDTQTNHTTVPDKATHDGTRTRTGRRIREPVHLKDYVRK